uniref:Uncharacterized protein n=1 Tax=Heliothis virescens TaxID=7102 RepID=A0A2A4J307_HELVI
MPSCYTAVMCRAKAAIAPPPRAFHFITHRAGAHSFAAGNGINLTSTRRHRDDDAVCRNAKSFYNSSNSQHKGVSPPPKCVHGGLMLLEPRFTAELLAALLNIPANKTLLRRHLTQRFNDLLGRDVIQQKRNAEQTLGYQPLTATTKYKVPKKSQFSLKRKKSKDDLDLGDLVCPLHDDCSGDITNSPTMKVKSATADVASAVSPLRDEARAQ